MSESRMNKCAQKFPWDWQGCIWDLLRWPHPPLLIPDTSDLFVSLFTTNLCEVAFYIPWATFLSKVHILHLLINPRSPNLWNKWLILSFHYISDRCILKLIVLTYDAHLLSGGCNQTFPSKIFCISPPATTNLSHWLSLGRWIGKLSLRSP